MTAVSDLFDSILGQSSAIRLLQASLDRDRLAPAYLFFGTPGVGKRLTARRFCQALLHGDNLNHPDLLWVEPTYLDKGKIYTRSEAIAANLNRKGLPQVRLEQIRQLTEFLGHAPLKSNRLVVVIEGAETMAEAAANALLKTLEEPGKATLVLISPGLDALLPTLVSRCQLIPFRRLSRQDLTQVLHRVLNQPNQSVQSDLWELLLAMGQGSPGETLKALTEYEKIEAIAPDLISQLTKHLENKQLKQSETPSKKTKLIQSLSLAKQIAQTLELEAQLWLLQLMHHSYWQAWHQPQVHPRLERSLLQLSSYV
ncbi:MAG: DNA polymerase III subunit delta', partial [Pseudanabaenaceae cyanobacterium bins.68]|nr:DNA polymerase III subunit delta' [Pseudanabaenaceae cyanobacterium bins.68]